MNDRNVVVSTSERPDRGVDWPDRVNRFMARVDRVLSRFVPPRLHQAWNLPPIDGSFTKTHSGDNLRVYVTPLHLPGRMRLNRVSMSAQGKLATDINLMFALYRLDQPSYVDRDDPVSGPRKLRRIGDTYTLSLSAADTTRLNYVFMRRDEMELNGALNAYYFGWTIDHDDGAVFCPNVGASAKLVGSFRCQEYATLAAGMPEEVEPVESITNVPSVILRSAQGVRRFGYVGED